MRISPPDWYQDDQNPYYSEGRFLLPGKGNNAFSFLQKPQRDPLLITPLRVGHLEDLKVSSHVSFQDFENDQWLACEGLQAAILCLDFPLPLYIVDNHNHVFYCWAEALKMGWISKGGLLIHMDEHFDALKAPHLDVQLNNLLNVWTYTNETLQIATYIDPSLRLGLFSECKNYVESPDFELFDESQRQVVINIDLDVFCEDMKHISWSKKIDVLKYYLPRAQLITFATSPSFIDQQRAIDLVHRIVEALWPEE